METLKFWDKFTLSPPSPLESYQSFYMSAWAATNPYESSIFTVIGVLEKEYIIAKNLNTTFRPEYDVKKDDFILKLLEAWKVIIQK